MHRVTKGASDKKKKQTTPGRTTHEVTDDPGRDARGLVSELLYLRVLYWKTGQARGIEDGGPRTRYNDRW